MHPDGKTLYFCSEGHNSMGGYDIFKAIRDTNSSNNTEVIVVKIQNISENIYECVMMELKQDSTITNEIKELHFLGSVVIPKSPQNLPPKKKNSQ